MFNDERGSMLLGYFTLECNTDIGTLE